MYFVQYPVLPVLRQATCRLDSAKRDHGSGRSTLGLGTSLNRRRQRGQEHRHWATSPFWPDQAGPHGAEGCRGCSRAGPLSRPSRPPPQHTTLPPRPCCLPRARHRHGGGWTPPQAPRGRRFPCQQLPGRGSAGRGVCAAARPRAGKGRADRAHLLPSAKSEISWQLMSAAEETWAGTGPPAGDPNAE